MIDLAPESTVEQSVTLAIPVLAPARLALLPVKLLLSLAAWYRHHNAFAGATQTLAVAAERSASFQLAQEWALLAVAQGDTAAACERLRHEAETRNTLTARGAYARLLLEAGDLATGGEIVARQLAANPEAVTIQALAADYARASGDVAGARDAYAATLALSPGNFSARLGLARLALESGNRGEAASRLAELLADDSPRSANALHTLAALAQVLDQPVRAAALRARAATLEQVMTARLWHELSEQLGELPGAPGGDHASDALVSFAPAGSGKSRLALPVSPDAATGMAPTPADTPALQPAPDTPGEHLPRHASPGVETIQDTIPDVEPVPSAPTAVEPRVLAILREDFGYDSLRTGQAEVIAQALAGRNTLAIMPTGAGKSLTFQIPAMLGDGVTLVVSPLIALMKDQYDSLPPALRARSALLNSTLSSDEQREVLQRLRQGEYKLIYAAPERLRHHGFVRELRQAGVSLVVVDEAHCISLWGHDFRPDYLTIPAVLGDLGEPPLLAITATATPRMAGEIKRRFGRDLAEVRTSVYRPNLFYEAHVHGTREQKIEHAISICREERGTGIIYARSRRDTEAIAALLRDRRVSAVPYHAGLDGATRAANQERFMAGEARVVVATTAFGMGINKADVRFIVHLSPPNSLEAYAQESGRAGRDGGPARCVLLATKSDKSTLTRMARGDLPAVDDLRRVYAGLKQAAVGRWALVSPDSLTRWQSFDQDAEQEPDPRIALGLLEQAGLLRRYADQPTSYSLPRATTSDADADADADVETAAEWARLQQWMARTGEGGGFRTAEALAALDWSPDQLTRVLTAHVPRGLREGPRQGCFELLPAGADALARIEHVLAAVRQESDRRITQVMAYVQATRCRHVILANHLGERLAACGENCDICQPASGHHAAPAATATERTRLTAEDARTVLLAMASLPIGLGKPGLVKFLLGSIESRLRGDRSPYFGRLASVRKSALEKLLDRMVEAGLIEAHLERDYRLLRPTAAGRRADVSALADLLPGSPEPRQASDTPSHDGAPVDEALFERLREWRREQATANGMPPYVIAHDAALRALAEHRPRSLRELADVPGFGPAKIERYGEALITVISDASGAEPLP